MKVNSSFGFRVFIFCEFMLSFRESRLCFFWCYVCNLHTYRNHKAFLFICTSIWLFHLINNTCMSKSLRFLYYRSVRDTKWKNRWKAKGNVTYTCELSQLLNFFSVECMQVNVISVSVAHNFRTFFFKKKKSRLSLDVNIYI